MICPKLVDETSRILASSIIEMCDKDSFFYYDDVRKFHMEIFLKNVKDFYENKQYYYSRIKQTGLVQSVVCDNYGFLYLKVHFEYDYYSFLFKNINGDNIQ